MLWFVPTVLAHDAMHKCGLCRCAVSVMFMLVYSGKMNKHIFNIFSLLGSLRFFLIWGDTCSLRMAALRPALQAGPMRNPREETSVVLRDTRLT